MKSGEDDLGVKLRGLVDGGGFLEEKIEGIDSIGLDGWKFVMGLRDCT